MAAERSLMAFGFDCGLDWRPTVFVEGVSSNRVCDACGLVPSTVALLSCRHVLCQPCYNRTIANDGCCCLDGDAIKGDDVVWLTFSAESLLERKIHCWNAPAGCSASGPAQEILEHFGKECEYHAVVCPRCERIFDHVDFVDHITAGSCVRSDANERPTCRNGDPEVKQITSVLRELQEKVSFLQATLEENLERIADSTKTAAEGPHPDFHLLESNQCLENTIRESTQLSRQALAQMGEANAGTQNKLEEISTSLHNISEVVSDLRASVSQTLKEKERAAMVAYAGVKRNVNALKVASSAERKKNERKIAMLDKIVHEIKANAASEKSFREEVGAKLAVIEAVSCLPFNKKLNTAEPLEWSIGPVAKLKKQVKGETIFARSSEYFYGYHILPGVNVDTEYDGQSLRLEFRMCRGVYDQILTWPIKKTLYLRFLHPTKKGQNESIFINTALKDFERYRMPTEERNEPVWSIYKVLLKKLEEGGYVKDDKILVRFEVHS